MSPTYDPKARRAHSPTAPEGPAPVDELLGTPTEALATTPSRPDEDAGPTGTAPVGRPHAPAPPPTNPGPDPRLFAAIAVAVAAVMVWRWRSRH